jgi:hypothetical protein
VLSRKVRKVSGGDVGAVVAQVSVINFVKNRDYLCTVSFKIQKYYKVLKLRLYVLCGYENKQRVLCGYENKQRVLCGYENKQRVLCGYENKQRVLCGYENKQRVLCGSQNKQRVSPYMALADWFCITEVECLLRGTE